MDGEQNGTQTQQDAQQQEQQASQQQADQQETQAGNAADDRAEGSGAGAAAYEAQLAERDSRIAELESQVAGFDGVATKSEDLSAASAEDILAALRAVTNEMEQVSTGSRYLFITPTLKGIVDDLCAKAHRSSYVASNPMCRTDVF